MKYIKRLFVVVIFIHSFLVNISGQSAEIDSLEVLLNNYSTADTIQVNMINDIAQKAYIRDVVKCEKYARRGLELSNSLSFHKGKARSLWLIGLATMKNNAKGSLDNFEEALKISEVIQDDLGVARYLQAIANVTKRMGDLDASIKASTKALEVAEKINDESLIQTISIRISQHHMTKGDYVAAAHILYEIVKKNTNEDDQLFMATVYSNLATVNMLQGNATTALDYYYKTLTLFEKKGSINGCILTLVNIACVQAEYKETDSALESINKALALAEQAQDSMRISLCYTVMGDVYNNIDKQKALTYYTKAHNMPQQFTPKQEIVNLLNIGSILLDLKEYEKSLLYLKDALGRSIKSEIKSSIGDVHVKLGEYYHETNNQKAALVHADAAEEIALAINSPTLQSKVYKLISDVQSQLGDFRSALTHHKRYASLNDSIYNEKNASKMALLESEYQFSKERDQYEHTQQQGKILIKTQRQFIWLLIIISVLVVLLALLMYRSSRLKKRFLSMQLETINQELDTKRRDVTVAQLKLVQNAERDAYTVKALEDIAEAVKGDERAELKSLIGNYKQEAFHSNWKEFETLFTQVNAEFWDKLNKLYPSLTPNERRLCVFMKLNMSNKDISQITLQTEDALKKSRTRLRKKFELERSTNLTAFIQSI